MELGEPVKLFAARISLVTQKFFNKPDLTIPSVKTLFEQSKLSKFLEGILPEFKHPTLMKDPQTFQAALDFVELLEANKSCFPQHDQNSQTSPMSTSINTVSDQNSNKEIKSLLETRAKQTHDFICTLSNEVHKLKGNRHNQVQYTPNLNQNYRRSPHNGGNLVYTRSFPIYHIVDVIIMLHILVSTKEQIHKGILRDKIRLLGITIQAGSMILATIASGKIHASIL